MAGEFGLGITPWSPLGGGALSGKYTRSNAGQNTSDRAALVEGFLNEKTYDVVDELEIIAKAHETTVASVALAWLHAQPAVTSIIIGARRLSQFEDNIRALDVNLTAKELGRLNAITEPIFGFPQTMLPMAPGIINGGTTINGVSAPISEYVMPEGKKPY
jgi:aryl-alcohol dehydrogenase-like predicted oxidoreductase